MVAAKRGDLPDLDSKLSILGQLVHMLVPGGVITRHQHLPDWSSAVERGAMSRKPLANIITSDVFKAADQILKNIEN